MLRTAALLLAACCLVASAAPRASAGPALPPHPRLLVTRGEVAAIKQRMSRSPWARAFYQGLQARCAARDGKAVTLPPRGGQWWHWYSCPKHGARLRTESPTRHVCPVDGEVFTGYPYDDVVLSADHDRLATDARDLGLLYVLTGERKWADKAREILLAYADRYLSYPLHDIRGKPTIGGGRVLPQTLDESIWLISMAYGADLVWDTLSPAEVETLRSKLFYPAAVDVIQKHRMGIHNIQCWKNSAVGLVGLLFGDQALIDDAIDGPRGYRAQMAKGVRPDGAWYEGAWGYHFYTMDALHHLTEAAHRCGIDLYGDDYKRMFLAPLVLAMPNGQLPAFNDSGTATAHGNANYEVALARYHDPALAAALRGTPRSSLQAFLCGVDPLPPAPAAAEASTNYPASGYAILRSGTGTNAAWLCLKYGPHGGGHGHPDKASFVLYSQGRVVAGDPGTSAYGVPIHAGWYRTTLAHNTLLADETNQQPAEGKCLRFEAQRAWSAALVDAGSAVPGVTFRRAAFMLGGKVVVFVDCAWADDGKERTFDLAYHPAGRWVGEIAGSPVTPPERPGYSYLQDLHQTTADGGLTLGLSDGAASGPASWWVTFAGMGPTTYWTGTGVGGSTDDRVPIVIARRAGTSVCHVWAVSLQPGGRAPRVTSTASGPHGPVTARVELGGQAWSVTADPEAGTLSVKE